MRSTPDPYRKPSFDHPPSPSPPPSLDPHPATFFLSRNPHVSDLEPSIPVEGPDDAKESMYGIQSLSETLYQSEYSESVIPDSPQLATDDLEYHLARRRSTLKADAGTECSWQASPAAVSRPLTPLTMGIPDEPSSLPSSPKSISNQSLRPLDDISITDEINSQAVGSGDEEEPGSPRMGGASQLIMPSIKMPSRRPFTERGKAMGRFKILLAGPVGKSGSITNDVASN
jgi:hypothetical protein